MDKETERKIREKIPQISPDQLEDLKIVQELGDKLLSIINVSDQRDDIIFCSILSILRAFFEQRVKKATEKTFEECLVEYALDSIKLKNLLKEEM